MKNNSLPEEFIRKLKAVRKKRPKTVINHILKHGYITTEELQKQYGYKHPPRAARDVRENGIPLETFSFKNEKGKTIAAYKFADLSKIKHDKIGGRKVIPKHFKEKLIGSSGCKCALCLQIYEERYLQTDHRIPYEITGDYEENKLNIENYMLVCGSCNRAKSWSCEHCINWIKEKSLELCKSCYWSNPNTYKHISLKQIRRLDIVWTEKEIDNYNKLQKQSEKLNITMPDYVKSVLNNYLKNP